jgi:hypothetical protein
MENFASVDRQQRNGSSEQHGEKIERDRAQDELLANAVLNVMGSRRRAVSSGLMRKVEIRAPMAVRVAAAYTTDGPRNMA